MVTYHIHKLFTLASFRQFSNGNLINSLKPLYVGLLPSDELTGLVYAVVCRNRKTAIRVFAKVLAILGKNS